MNVEFLWSNFLDQIKDKLSPVLFNTWFSETKLYRLHNGNAYIVVPLSVHKRHLIDNYNDLIVNTLSDVTGSMYDLVLLLEDEVEEEKKKEVLIKQEKIENDKIQSINKFHSNLMTKYTFDNFIVGNSNKFAHAAALSVAENPGRTYNPLFIYGNSGLGKTHLMHAIGNYITKNSNKKVLYVTSEQFVSDFIGINKKDIKNTKDIEI